MPLQIRPQLTFPGNSLCGGHLLGDRVVGFVVSDAVESLAVELGEPDAVGLLGDEEIQGGPDQGQAAVLAGERPITLVRRLTSPSDRSSRFR